MEKKETPQAYIRRLHINLQSEKTNCQQMYLNYPDRIYKIGDQVKYGNWDWSSILDIFDKGKYYKVLTITSNIHYKTFRITYLPWISLLPYRTIEQATIPPELTKNKDLLLNYSQRDIYSLMHMYYNFGLDLNPDYQRGNVWSQDDKVLLIDSIFKNIDIGKFTIIKRPFRENKQSYEILDGKQRVIALLEFSEDKFKYKGLKFSELHRRDQNHFGNYSISYAEASPMSHEQKYRYFLNLNITGKAVDPNHINYVKDLLFLSRAKKKYIEKEKEE
jgi:hypothetical protein